MDLNREREVYVGILTSCLKDFCDFLISKKAGVTSEEIRTYFSGLRKLFKKENLREELFDSTVQFISSSISELNEGLADAVNQALAGKKLKINLKQETIDLLENASKASDELADDCIDSTVDFEEEEQGEITEETTEYVFNLMNCFRRFIVANNGKFNSIDLRKALLSKVEEGVKAKGGFKNTSVKQIVNTFFNVLAYEHTDDIYQIIEAIDSSENTYIELDSKSVILLSIANMEQLITYGDFEDLYELGEQVAKELRILTDANKDFNEILFYIQNKEFESEQVKVLLTNLIKKIATK